MGKKKNISEEIYVLYTWDLTENEMEEFTQAEINDVVHIESQMVPLVIQLENEGEDRYALVGYTSHTEIPQEYVRQYTVVQCSIEKILLDMKAVGILLGKPPVLAINVFTEKEKIVTLDQMFGTNN